MFLHDHHVIAIRHRCAGEDAYRRAGRGLSLPGATGGGLSDHRQGQIEIGAPDRIAIHGGGVERRLRQPGADRGGQDAVQPFGQRNFLAADRAGECQHPRQCLVNRDHFAL